MLDKRLNTIFNMISDGMVVADIGTDHAFLPIKLIKENKCDLVYACDVAMNPLNIAKKNIVNHKMSDNIKTVLSNGLSEVSDDVNCVVIAGMGFYTCKSILENSFNKLKNYKEIIVQINNDVELFRKWLSDNNFKIIDEKIVEVKHYYTIIKFNTEYNDNYTDNEIMFGPILLKENSKEFRDYLNYRLTKLENIKSKVKDKSKIDEIENIINEIKKVLN